MHLSTIKELFCHALTPQERAELLPSGQQGVFKNRIGWTRTYLRKAELIESSKRATFKINDRGTLAPLAEFVAENTPEEAVELAYQGLREELEQELLIRVLGCSPSFFEQLVVELLDKDSEPGRAFSLPRQLTPPKH